MLITILCLARYIFNNNKLNYWTLLVVSKFRFSVGYQNAALTMENPDQELVESACEDQETESKVTLMKTFEAAVKVIQSLPKDGPYQPSNSSKLRFYSLYKQSIEGKCTQAQPSMFNIIGRAKWDHWNKLGDMDKEEAMVLYIEELKKIVETMSFSGDVQEFLETINPFYEFVNLQGPEMAHVKESLDQWTSSSSESSSSATTPVKWTNHKVYGNGIVPNGHTIIDKESLEEPEVHRKIPNGHLPNHSLSNEKPASSYHPPGTPVHRRSIVSISPEKNAEDEDEVLEVNLDAEEPDLDREGVQSQGSESEKYYSGDSDVDPGGNSPLPSSSANTTIELEDLRNTLPHSSKTLQIQSDTDIVLRNTVERLNRDVDHMLARIRLLETAYANSPDGSSSRGGERVIVRKPRILGLSPSTFGFVVTWPFLAYFIIQLIKLWIQRRRRI